MTKKVSDQLVDAMPVLDDVSETIKKVTAPLVGEDAPQQLKDALVGTWLGHPLHPAVILAPIGCWTSAMVLDLAGGYDEAADLLIGVGLASAGVAAVTGAAQYYDATTNERPRRLGALHAMVNSAAAGLYAASLAQRKRGNRKAGRVLATAGFLAVNAGGLLGGDLSYDLGIGVDHAAFEQPPTEWTTVLDENELVLGEPKRVEVDGAAIMLLKHEHGIHAIGAVCPHLGGPLDEGKIEGETVTCPWHGSVFCVTDGKLLHGPATAPVTRYEARVTNGKIEVRSVDDPKEE